MTLSRIGRIMLHVILLFLCSCRTANFVSCAQYLQVAVNYLSAPADETSASYLHVGRRRIITQQPVGYQPTAVMPSPDTRCRRPTALND